MHIFLSVLLLILGYAFAYPLLFVAFVPMLLRQANESGSRVMLGRFLTAFIPILLFYGLVNVQIAAAAPGQFSMYIILFSLLLALTIALPWMIRPVLGLQRAMIALPFFWILVEWLQLRYSLGSTVLGNALPASISGWYAYMGVLGGSLWIWLFNLVGFAIVRSFVSHKQWKPLIGQSVVAVLMILVLPAWLLPTPTSEEPLQAVRVGVGDSPVDVTLKRDLERELQTLYRPIYSPYDFINAVWSDALVLEAESWNLPLSMQKRILKSRALEVRRPVVWINDGVICAINREGQFLSHANALELETSTEKTYVARSGSFPARIGVFVAIFTLLYTVSFTLRGASLHRKD